MALGGKNPPVNTGDIRDVGSIPGSGRSPGGRKATCSSILAWRIPWSEEPGGLQTTGSQRVTLECLSVLILLFPPPASPQTLDHRTVRGAAEFVCLDILIAIFF